MDLYSHTTATLQDEAADRVATLIFGERTVTKRPS
jgi:hypothetical protein